MARIVAISNQKGGVGKTTTAVNLAAALAAMGRRVLVVDLDPQGNASSGLGYPRTKIDAGLYDVMFEFRDIDSVLLPTAHERLHLLPATRDLVGAELELVTEENRERRLRKMLSEVRNRYDEILVDCPPSLGLLTVNALVGSDAVLIPLQAEYFAMEGLGELLRTISAVRKSWNPDLQREGIVITMTDNRNNLCREVEDQARSLFGDGVLQTVIPRNVRLGEAPSFGQPIVQYDPRSAGARAYFSLAEEILARRGTGGTAWVEAK
ncbi:MAG: AAA family ATPase [Myxococcota bacterium]